MLERPKEAEQIKFLATPTLIKELPLPSRRIIGDLADMHQVISWIKPEGYATAKKEKTA